MTTELVIFDCDGVLVDSERLAVRVEARLLTELGWELTEADVLDRFVGRSDNYMFDQIDCRSSSRPSRHQAEHRRDHGLHPTRMRSRFFRVGG